MNTWGNPGSGHDAMVIGPMRPSTLEHIEAAEYTRRTGELASGKNRWKTPWMLKHDAQRGKSAYLTTNPSGSTLGSPPRAEDGRRIQDELPDRRINKDPCTKPKPECATSGGEYFDHELLERQIEKRSEEGLRRRLQQIMGCINSTKSSESGGEEQS